MTLVDNNPEVDVEDYICAYLVAKGILPAAQIAGRMPPQLTPPFILVQRVAGGDDFIVDHPTVSIHSFHSDQTDASTIARNVDHVMRQLRAKTPVTIPGGTVVTPYGPTLVEQRPIFVPWQPEGGGAVIARYVGRYLTPLRLPSITGF
jgi:hypothetical protein